MIDINKYKSNSGMATSKWGPSAWDFLFVSILGRYPMVLKDTIEHHNIRASFKSLLTSLDIILPCIYCRNSFSKFLKELPIEKYLVGRIELMYWLYSMKDKVNNKLILQEMKCFLDEKSKLKKKYYAGELGRDEYHILVKNAKHEIFVTERSPSFKNVLDHFEQFRAVCVDKNLKCSLPKK